MPLWTMLWVGVGIKVSAAQSPEDAWRTVETAHYRLHYPLESEAWALYSAARLEAIRALVAAEVGYAPTTPIELVVMDPFAQANGFAIPLLRSPRMGVFPTPPPPASGIGHYRTWTEDLIIHEDAHLAHLLRPSRNPALRLMGLTLGVGPISMGSPAWLIEGYATVVEGRLTGLGRPYSSGRAAFLRKLVLDGDLPAYAELDAPDRWASGAYRYLVGSAYLEWLEARTHEGALQDLWARMTAVEIRDFDLAFEGVFGDTPEALYRRFVAELTHEALLIERVRPEDAETLWQDLEWSVDAPAVSPDGRRLALIQRSKLGAPRLVVYPTAPDMAEAKARWEEDHLPDLEADPEDVAPVPPAAYPLEPLHSRALGGHIPDTVRWIDDQTLLFTSFVRGPSGDLHPDLFLWRLPDDASATHGGEVRRVTRGAEVRDADPHGDHAFGLQTQGGLSRLVRVPLNTTTEAGEDASVVALTEDGPAVALSQPRVRADGKMLAWVANRGAGWQIEVAPLTAEGLLAESPAVVALPPQAEVLSIAWQGDGLVASLGRGGFVEVYALPLDGGPWRQLTRSRGGALAPAPTPDGQAIFYLVPDVEGHNLHRLSLDRVQQATVGTPDDADIRAALGLQTGVVRPPALAAPLPPLATETVTASRYGMGRPHLRIASGATAAPQQSNLELGLSVSDIVGRYEVVGLASLGDAAPVGPATAFDYRGARLALTWRGLPVRLRLEGVHLNLPSSSSSSWGAVLDGYRQRIGPHSAAEARVSALWLPSPVLGAEGEGGVPAVDARLSGYAQRWRGPVWLGGGADLWGQGRGEGAGEPRSVVRGAGWLGWGTNLLGMSGEVEGTAGPMGLGGLEEALYPEAFQIGQLWAPGLVPSPEAALDPVLRVRGDLGGMGVWLFGEHHALPASEAAGGAGGYTRLGLEAKGSVAPQPLVATAGLFLEAGVACLAETPEEGWRDKACLGIDDWSAWLGLRVQPGQETLIPRSMRDLLVRERR